MTEKDHILVVEDDPLVSEVIAAALEDTYRITLVATARDAMTHLREGGIRLMLMDCTLPDGVDDALIPEADRAGTQVILMSGDRSRIERIVAQPRPFVLKPFTLTGLLSKVEQVIAESG